jgi:Flp pilus assembly protein TadD
MRQAQQAMRDGKLEDALAVYRKELAANPNSPQANNAAGTVLDLMGNGAEARKHFQKVIDSPPTPPPRPTPSVKWRCPSASKAIVATQ